MLLWAIKISRQNVHVEAACTSVAGNTFVLEFEFKCVRFCDYLLEA